MHMHAFPENSFPTTSKWVVNVAGLLKLDSLVFIGCLAEDTWFAVQVEGRWEGTPEQLCLQVLLKFQVFQHRSDLDLAKHWGVTELSTKGFLMAFQYRVTYWKLMVLSYLILLDQFLTRYTPMLWTVLVEHPKRTRTSFSFLLPY